MSGKPTDIDQLYGLEPVIALSHDAGGDGVEPFVDLMCPYCGETLNVQLDLSAGSQSYVEDCHVCCQPIQIALQVDEGGRLESVLGERMDR